MNHSPGRVGNCAKRATRCALLALAVAACGDAEPEPGHPVTTDAPALLCDIRAWAGASPAERRRVAADVDASLPRFELLELRKFPDVSKYLPAELRELEIAIYVDQKTDLEFSLVPGGQFMMGAPDDAERARPEDKPAHRVTLTQPFMICRTPVTDRVWDAIGGGIPRIEYAKRPIPGTTANAISWKNAGAWCRVAGLALPTEAQWEWAARGGTDGPRYFHGRPAPFDGPRPRGIEPERGPSFIGGAAQSVPNALGLHDMHGNDPFVSPEWTSDRFAYYPTGDVTDPHTPSGGDPVFRNPEYISGLNRPYHVWTRGTSLKAGWTPLGRYENLVAVRPVFNLKVVAADRPK